MSNISFVQAVDTPSGKYTAGSSTVITYTGDAIATNIATADNQATAANNGTFFNIKTNTNGYSACEAATSLALGWSSDNAYYGITLATDVILFLTGTVTGESFTTINKNSRVPGGATYSGTGVITMTGSAINSTAYPWCGTTSSYYSYYVNGETLTASFSGKANIYIGPNSTPGTVTTRPLYISRQGAAGGGTDTRATILDTGSITLVGPTCEINAVTSSSDSTSSTAAATVTLGAIDWLKVQEATEGTALGSPQSVTIEVLCNSSNSIAIPAALGITATAQARTAVTGDAYGIGLSSSSTGSGVKFYMSENETVTSSPIAVDGSQTISFGTSAASNDSTVSKTLYFDYVRNSDSADTGSVSGLLDLIFTYTK